MWTRHHHRGFYNGSLRGRASVGNGGVMHIWRGCVQVRVRACVCVITNKTKSHYIKMYLVWRIGVLSFNGCFDRTALLYAGTNQKSQSEDGLASLWWDCPLQQLAHWFVLGLFLNTKGATSIESKWIITLLEGCLKWSKDLQMTTKTIQIECDQIHLLQCFHGWHIVLIPSVAVLNHL